MPQLVDGRWVKDDVAASEMKNGAFHREPTRFRDLEIAAEPGRYQLFVAYICPWASRTLMMRALKGLEKILPIAVSEPELGEDGWRYDIPVDAGPKAPPIRFQHQLYTTSDPHYTGKVSVPVLWDRQEGCIVNNESADILRILNHAFDDLTGNRSDFYPQALRGEIDHWNGLIYDSLNNGVYRAGFAKSQAAYEAAVKDVFAMLDRLEAHLATHRYLAGAFFTEADIRLFVTLIRFDAAYHGVFKCNLRRLADYANLQAYLREILQWPGIAATVRIDHIKRGYYSIAHLNPTGIVPLGPLQDFFSAHGREHLPGEGVWQKAA